MRRLSPTIRAYLLLLGLAILAMPSQSGHLHFCFDGQEPPVSVHMDDMGVPHTQHELSNPHSDAELSLTNNVVIKKIEGGLDVPIKFFAATLILLTLSFICTSGGLQIPRTRRSPIAFTSISFAFRPPLRAPPL